MVISQMGASTSSFGIRADPDQQTMIELILHYALSLVECGKEGNDAVQLDIFNMLNNSSSGNAFMVSLSNLISVGRSDLKGQMKQLKKAERKERKVDQSLSVHQNQNLDGLMSTEDVEKARKKSRKLFKNKVHQIVQMAGENGCVPEVRSCMCDN